MPSQVVESTRYWDGGLKTARVAFVARDVPAIGYRTFHASPSKGSAAGDDRTARDPDAETGRGRDDPRERALPRFDRPVHRRDGGPGLQAGELAGALGPRQRRLARRRPRRLLGALQRPGRRKPDRHDQPAEGAEPREGGLQRRRQGRAGDGDRTVRSSPSFESRDRSAPASSRPRSGFSRGCAGSRSRRGWSIRRSTSATRRISRRRSRKAKRLTRFPSDRSIARARIEFPAQNWVDYGDGRRGLALAQYRIARQSGLRRNDAGLVASRPHARRLWFRRRLRAGDVVGDRLSARPGADDALCPGPARGRLARGRRLPRRLGVQHPLVCRNCAAARRLAAEDAGGWSKSRVPTWSSRH